MRHVAPAFTRELVGLFSFPRLTAPCHQESRCLEATSEAQQGGLHQLALKHRNYSSSGGGKASPVLGEHAQCTPAGKSKLLCTHSSGSRWGVSPRGPWNQTPHTAIPTQACSPLHWRLLTAPLSNGSLKLGPDWPSSVTLPHPASSPLWPHQLQ